MTREENRRGMVQGRGKNSEMEEGVIDKEGRRRITRRQRKVCTLAYLGREIGVSM